MMWVTTFTHPISLDVCVRGELPACGPCNAVRAYIPGVTPLRPVQYEGNVKFIFERSGQYWYKLSDGKIVEAKTIKFVKK